MEERPWREKEPPFGGCSFSLQTSLNLPELPPNPRRFRSEDLFRFLKTAGIWGKFFSFGEVERFCKVRLSRPIGGGSAVGYDIQAKDILQMRPTHKTGAKPHSAKKIPPQKQKTFPKSTRPNIAKQIFAISGRVLLGKVLGREGGLEGESPSFKRGSLPPRSSSLQGLPHFLSSLTARAHQPFSCSEAKTS